MADSRRQGTWRFVAVGLLLLAAAGGYLAYKAARGTSKPFTYQPTTAPSTKPVETPTSTQPATRPKGPTTTFIDIVRAAHPTYTTTRPLEVPMRELADAGRMLLNDPVYMGPSYRADLWITRNDGLATPAALKRAMDPDEYPQVHVLPERVVFVHWNPDTPRWTPFLVCLKDDGSLEVVSPKRREPIPIKREFDWDRAMSWDDKIVVPSKSGVSVFRFEPKVTEDFRFLADRKKSHAKPQALLDWQGMIAWVPTENGRRGSVGAARYVDDKWTDLGPNQGWPEQILHLVPLRDGSVLQFVAKGENSVALKVATLAKVEVDEQAVTKLVEQMSDPDNEKREAAFKELSQYGPGAFAILEKLTPDQPPEARARLRLLLRGQVTPTLGGMTLIGDQLVTVTRQKDGAIVFYTETGVSIPREDSEPIRRVPAWITLRPGRAAEVLDDSLVSELKPGGCQILAMAGEWIITGDAPGPRRWFGNGFAPLLRKDEAAFSDLVGIDRKGRWLFRKPGDLKQTLVLDPTLPDPTPRLPVWEYAAANDIGWDASDWPAVHRNGADWSLREFGWYALDEKKNEKLLTTTKSGGAITDFDQAPIGAKWTEIESRTKPLLTDPSGTQFYDGVTALRLTHRSGEKMTWPLPAAATGKTSPPPVLLRTSDGVLYLFNQPGRILRIRPTPDRPEPFAIEATFTNKVPSLESPRRIWLDPAGRIVIADRSRLVIFFPQGFIPPRIRDLMLVDQSDGS